MYKTSAAQIQKSKKTSPVPQAVVMSGILAALEPSKKRFQFNIKKGENILGKIAEDILSINQIRKLQGQHVTIKGMLYLKASGKPRFLEAEMITAWQEGDEIFETWDASSSTSQFHVEGQSALVSPNLGTEIWGKWPGEESIEQLLDMLKSSEMAG